MLRTVRTNRPKSNYPELTWYSAVAAVPQKRFRHSSAGGAEASTCGGYMLGDEEVPPKPTIAEHVELRNVPGNPPSAEFLKKKAKFLKQVNLDEATIRKLNGGKLIGELGKLEASFSTPWDAIEISNYSVIGLS